MFHVDFKQACGRQVMVYGQTEVMQDLYVAQDAIGATIIHNADNVALYDLTSAPPARADGWHSPPHGSPQDRPAPSGPATG
ncbi:hypothetical protein [Gemmobacter aquatilis]|uniref:hypothetical protein n=1 Tax=Gemmobacter aquatilis TaxID=933059 RepID=UPI000A7352EA